MLSFRFLLVYVNWLTRKLNRRSRLIRISRVLVYWSVLGLRLSKKRLKWELAKSFLLQKIFNFYSFNIINPPNMKWSVCFRAGIPPFVSARSVLEPLTNGVTKSGVKVKKESPDVLELCHTVPQEVVNLSMFPQSFMCNIDAL